MIEQEKIPYLDIISLGFTEIKENDEVYFDEFGFDYTIITKELTDTIHLDWAKETQLCQLERIDNPENGELVGCLPIYNLDYLKEVIKFYSNTI